jgi:hypothetical protein
MEWISVKERLPEDGVDVLAIFKGQVQQVSTYRPTCTCTSKWHGNGGNIPTHWQPLPAPPKESQ